MRAYRLTGAPDLEHGLVLDERAPEPTRELGPYQVRVGLRAASINFRDLMILRGSYAVSARPGTIPLSDGAGEVVATGDRVTRAAVGELVATTYFLRWVDGALTPDLAAHQFGATHDGVLAEELVCDEESLVRVPGHLSATEAATLPCSAVTAWSALGGPHPVRPGQTVLTLGAGGVSLFAVLLAKAGGARVVAATSTPEKAEVLRALGADDVVDYTRHPDWDRVVRDLTGGAGADRVVETVGPDTLERSVRATAFGGEIAHVGGGGFSDAAAAFDPTVLHGRSLSLRRITVGSRRDFEQLNRALDLHRLHPVVDRVVPFAAAASAYHRLEDRAHVGKVVVAID